MGDGFDLTNAPAGVPFAIEATDFVYQVAWTMPGRRADAWLVLDRNDNGRIDNGLELFGNFTDQPEPAPGEERNGFRALAELDKAALGGNNNGLFDRQDAMFSEVRLWQDRNHNGVSESSELHQLSSFDIVAISLAYRRSRRVDEFGNRFAYRARVFDGGSSTGRWAYDVFLKVDRLTN